MAAHGSYQQCGPCIVHFLQLRAHYFLASSSIAPQGQFTLTHHHIQFDLSLPLQKQDVLCKQNRITTKSIFKRLNNCSLM